MKAGWRLLFAIAGSASVGIVAQNPWAALATVTLCAFAESQFDRISRPW